MRSPYFYSWKSGYKLFINLYPQGVGDGEGTHLSIYIQASQHGEFEQILSKSILNVEVALLSQQEDEENEVGYLNDLSLNDMRVGSGFPFFFPLEELENSPYLENDTIFIQVTCTKD